MPSLPAPAACARSVPRAVPTAAARRGRLKDLHPERAPAELNAIELCDDPVRRLRGLDFNEAEAARAMTAAEVSAFVTNGPAHAPVMPTASVMSTHMSGSSVWSGLRAASGSGCGRPSARLTADPTNCLSLTTHVGQQAGIRGPLQPLLDQSPEDDLQTHGQPHGRRRPPREDAGAVDEIARQDNQDARLALEHSVGPPRDNIYNIYL
jgi:hypothetical protein